MLLSSFLWLVASDRHSDMPRTPRPNWVIFGDCGQCHDEME
jgi:hypothetical protein